MKNINFISTLLFSVFISTSIFAHEIGEYYQGGVIFWIDESTNHGLIAASSDQARGVKWANRQYVTGATQDGIYAGKFNTKRIEEALGPAGNYAAKIAASCRDGGYNDWYLPSKYELNLMFKQRYIIGEFSVYTGPADNSCKSYWSSNEFEVGQAWFQQFDTGAVSHGSSACGISGAYGGNVRAIRSF
ncbi:TPA: DUF1566 domain-containing protein [Legionella pneumophila]|uniref:Lcl domain-containing protein n=1 Tax=Legionella sp. PATHC039 TaxID=2992042 RepID=UPI001A2FF1AA|nr:DUF1566 domain-containing protein [Legionella sp. PATHC039]BCL64455.1 hypothetical protein [Legionella pneumophila serogroup 7]HAT8858972.1 DUF1566 domain-containing protein [Legionella pneumophila subsp. pneumophila]HAU1397742.1 DUF1566 domain-containing protein [Legionella pneumophila]MCW8395577.1 DUF1566 domain-containing protein [Legionella sp. PATHC039]HAT9650705.1 DUF1566 domain-containing protein [Legionella pneumophila subsp. pneumophila]